MIATVGDAYTLTRAMLGDIPGKIYKTADLDVAFPMAWRMIKSEMLKAQVPRFKRVATYTLGANVTALSPATAGITDFGELVKIEERTPGSSEPYSPPLEKVDDLCQRPASTMLCEFEWREDQFQFVGSTAARELRITYYESDAAPVGTDTPLAVDGVLNLVATLTAAIVAPWKGERDRGKELRVEALGPNVDGRGGLMQDFLAPMVRSLKPLQFPAYHADPRFKERNRGRKVPYVAANITGGQVPVLVSLTGVQDGENDTFLMALSGPVVYFEVVRDGLELTENVAYTIVGSQLKFIGQYIPQPTTMIKVKAYYGDATGHTSVGQRTAELLISGVVDGVNDTFTLNATPSYLWLFVNQGLMYEGIAYVRTIQQIVFQPGYIPQPGDLLKAVATI